MSDHELFRQIRAKAEPIFVENGKAIYLAEPTDSPLDYRRRLAETLKANTTLRRVDISRVPASEFGPVEEKIYADAARNARSPLDLKPGVLREIKKPDRSGRVVSEFVAGRGASAFREVYAACLAPVMVSPIYVDGKPAVPPVIPGFR